ncbi:MULTISPECIES: carboxymuconolactone decarboxylase family protein [unclassified Microbacterium]|uniref:carboxymuconolactone decarboxylase family protein n=1 Tax=unclassified Microbacterium TaxID=2609290 RepID=UPI001E44FE02|nr:carboxymuconolactone decarboxylase family protein [Microbacterium sp. Au-Mic1]MBS1699438.1 carboxymuconolactone decarboxylase family protein [Actinomycetota bacterium]MCE4025413.1 carboxymuconolactone decarboxylase family protein [Microbacterium sp. Au-Mic1]
MTLTETSTQTEQTVPIPVRLDIDTVAPRFSRALAGLDAAMVRELDAAGIDARLRELVRLRASQINGCSYCVDLHAGDAAKAGDTAARIAAVAVWQESPFFTARERAAFALTESITRLSETHVPDADWAAAATRFSPEELGALVSLIVVINAWNAVGVSTHAWTGSM